MKKSGITWDEVVFEKENHHIYHACSGFYGSEFDESVALILDGGGSIYQDGSDFREVETIFKLDYKSGVQSLWKHHTLAEQNTNIFVENLIQIFFRGANFTINFFLSPPRNSITTFSSLPKP